MKPDVTDRFVIETSVLKGHIHGRPFVQKTVTVLNAPQPAPVSPIVEALPGVSLVLFGSAILLALVILAVLAWRRKRGQAVANTEDPSQ